MSQLIFFNHSPGAKRGASQRNSLFSPDLTHSAIIIIICLSSNSLVPSSVGADGPIELGPQVLSVSCAYLFPLACDIPGHKVVMSFWEHPAPLLPKAVETESLQAAVGALPVWLHPLFLGFDLCREMGWQGMLKRSPPLHSESTEKME